MPSYSQIVLCILSLQSLPFYLVFILTIIRFIRTPLKYAKHLSFYQLILSCSIADVSYVFNYYLFKRFLKWEWLPYDLGGDWLARYSITVDWYLKYSQVIAVLLIGINRFCAIIKPVKYYQWKNSLTFKLICFQWTLPVLLTSPLLLCDIGAQQRINGTLISAIRGDKLCTLPSFLTSAAVQLDIAIALTVMYSMMFCKIRKQNRQVSAVFIRCRRKNDEERAQQKMAFSGAIIAGTLVFTGILNIVPIVTKGNVGPNFQDIFTFSLMLFSLVNPFVLVLISTNIRNVFKTTLKLLLSFKCPTKAI